MNRAQWVVVLKLRRRLKNSQALTYFNQLTINGVCHVGMGQFTLEYGRHNLKACFTEDLLRLRQASMTTAAFNATTANIF